MKLKEGLNSGHQQAAQIQMSINIQDRKPQRHRKHFQDIINAEMTSMIYKRRKNLESEQKTKFKKLKRWLVKENIRYVPLKKMSIYFGKQHGKIKNNYIFITRFSLSEAEQYYPSKSFSLRTHTQKNN